MTTTPTPLQRRAFELLGVSHRHGRDYLANGVSGGFH
jgi:hypothetical protein